MSVSPLETIPESSSLKNQLFKAAPAKNALATKTPRKIADSLPLARIGRAYGNDISKMNLMKPLARRSSQHEFREPWHSSSKTDTREYGDYYSWQARLTYLEVNRISIIASKGVKHFVDEYMKKLLKCEIFERGHNVELFASVRNEMLNKDNNSNSLKNDGFQDSKESFGINRYRKSARSIAASALKTIEMIRKYRSGQPIEDLLVANKEANISSVHDVDDSETITLKNPSPSVQSQKIISTSNIMTKRKNLKTTTNHSSLSQNQKSPSKQNRNSNKNRATGAGSSKYGSSTILNTSVQRQQQIQKRNVLDKKNVTADNENRAHEDSRLGSTSNRNWSVQNQKKSGSTIFKSSKSGSIVSHRVTLNNEKRLQNYENTDPSTNTQDITIKLNTIAASDQRSSTGKIRSRFNIFGARMKNKNSEKNGQKPKSTDSAVSHSSTTKNEPEHNQNTETKTLNLEQNPSDIPVVDGAVQNLQQNVEKMEERDNAPQKSHFSTNRATLYRKYHAEQPEKATDENMSVKSMQSVGSFDKDKFVDSEKALYPRIGSILSEHKSN